MSLNHGVTHVLVVGELKTGPLSLNLSEESARDYLLNKIESRWKV